MLRISPLRPAVAIVLLLTAGAIFVVRGPYRALRDSEDFATPYSSAKCWVAGLNPYHQATIDCEYRRAGGVPMDAESPQSLPTVFISVYPPSAFVLVSTLAGADWKTAKIAWMTINTLSFLASIVLVLKSAYNRSRQLAVYLLAFCLLFAPVQTGIAKGQLSVLAICLLTAALYLPVFPRRDLIAGLLDVPELLHQATNCTALLSLLDLAAAVGPDRRQHWRGNYRVGGGPAQSHSWLANLGQRLAEHASIRHGARNKLRIRFSAMYPLIN